MAKVTDYKNVNVTVNDQNDSFVPNKAVRSVTVTYVPEENIFMLKTPAPQIRREPTPPLFEQKEYGVTLTKLAKGYKATWDVNIQQAKTAGLKKVKAVIGDAVDAMFKEIEVNNL